LVTSSPDHIFTFQFGVEKTPFACQTEARGSLRGFRPVISLVNTSGAATA
jgi:hypothetical protein